MDRRINPFRRCSTTGVTTWYVLSCLWYCAYKKNLDAEGFLFDTKHPVHTVHHTSRQQTRHSYRQRGQRSLVIIIMTAVLYMILHFTNINIMSNSLPILYNTQKKHPKQIKNNKKQKTSTPKQQQTPAP